MLGRQMIFLAIMKPGFMSQGLTTVLAGIVSI